MMRLFNAFLLTMTINAVLVFIALHFVTACYGVFYNKKWGPALLNRQ